MKRKNNKLGEHLIWEKQKTQCQSRMFYVYQQDQTYRVLEKSDQQDILHYQTTKKITHRNTVASDRSRSVRNNENRHYIQGGPKKKKKRETGTWSNLPPIT